MYIDLDVFQHNTRRASKLLKAMSNERRLMILCQLMRGEKCVGELERSVRLSQSAISQHLARLRKDSLVRTRRAGQTIFYSLAGSDTTSVIEALHGIFCNNGGTDVEAPEKDPRDPAVPMVFDLLREVARNTSVAEKSAAAASLSVHSRDKAACCRGDSDIISPTPAASLWEKTCCMLPGNQHRKECCAIALRRGTLNGTLRPIRRPLNPTPLLANGNGCRVR